MWVYFPRFLGFGESFGKSAQITSHDENKNIIHPPIIIVFHTSLSLCAFFSISSRQNNLFFKWLRRWGEFIYSCGKSSRAKIFSFYWQTCIPKNVAMFLHHNWESDFEISVSWIWCVPFHGMICMHDDWFRILAVLELSEYLYGVRIKRSKRYLRFPCEKSNVLIVVITALVLKEKRSFFFPLLLLFLFK